MYPTIRNQFGLFPDFQRFIRAEQDTNRTHNHSLYSTEQGWTLRVDLPGFTEKEVDLNVEKSVLHLSASSDDSQRSQRGAVEHQFALGDDVNSSAITAKLNLGVLTIELPRKIEPKTTKVEITIEENQN